MIDQVLLTTLRIFTTLAGAPLTNATGFLFERKKRLFLVTSGHVVCDPESGHHPDGLTVNVHTDRNNIAEVTGFAIPLLKEGKPLWRDARDEGGQVDLAVVEIDRNAWPKSAFYTTFRRRHIPSPDAAIPVGSRLLTLGYPMGFQDDLHQLPVARQAALASPFGLRFQGKGYFLVDAWTHRGISGAPVVRPTGERGAFPYQLVGIHSSRLEANARDPEHDEVLGLNAAWYADILDRLTQ